MSQCIFEGSGVALVTPFSHGKVDHKRLESLIDWTLSCGVDFLVCLGTTGEAITLNKKECEEVKQTFLRVNKGRVPLVYGIFGSNNTCEVVERLETYNLQGIDGILSSSPNYNKPSQEGIFQHYKALEAKSPVPIIIYNVPSRTGSNVEASTILRLAHHSSKFTAVKEASGDLVQAAQIMKDKPQHFALLSGDDPLTLPMISLGAVGCISVIGNLYPYEWTQMIHRGLEGNYAKARLWNNALLDLHPWIYKEGNPVGIKKAMALKGLCSEEVRLPLVPFSEDNLPGLQQQLAESDRLCLALDERLAN